MKSGSCNRTPRKARRESRAWREASLGGTSLLRATYVAQRFASHTQSTFVIGTNARGASSCFGRSDRVLVPGSVIVVPPGEVHGGHRVGSEPWDYRAIYPTSEFLTELLVEFTGNDASKPGFSRLLYPDSQLVERFLRAHAALLSGTDGLEGEESMISFLTLLLARYSVPRTRPQRLGNEKRQVAKAIEFIHGNLDRSLSLGEIAAVAGYSRFHFLRLFANETGRTPHAYVMEQKVERAKSLLRSGDPIADVAYNSGFADQAHLTKRFRQLVGVTPREYQLGSV